MFQTEGENDQTFVDATGVGLVALNATNDTTSGEQNPIVNGVTFTATPADTTLVGTGGHSIDFGDIGPFIAILQDQ